MTIEVAYGPFEPDRRRMEPANRRKAPVPDGDRNDTRIGRRRAQRHMDGADITPKSEQVRRAVAKGFGYGGPCLGIDIEALPRRVKSDGREARKDRGDSIRSHRRHPSSAATPRNHCTTGPGNHSPAIRTSVRCT